MFKSYDKRGKMIGFWRLLLAILTVVVIGLIPAVSTFVIGGIALGFIGIVLIGVLNDLKNQKYENDLIAQLSDEDKFKVQVKQKRIADLFITYMKYLVILTSIALIVSNIPIVSGKLLGSIAMFLSYHIDRIV